MIVVVVSIISIALMGTSIYGQHSFRVVPARRMQSDVIGWPTGFFVSQVTRGNDDKKPWCMDTSRLGVGNGVNVGFKKCDFENVSRNVINLFIG